MLFRSRVSPVGGRLPWPVGHWHHSYRGLHVGYSTQEGLRAALLVRLCRCVLERACVCVYVCLCVCVGSEAVCMQGRGYALSHVHVHVLECLCECIQDVCVCVCVSVLTYGCDVQQSMVIGTGRCECGSCHCVLASEHGCLMLTQYEVRRDLIATPVHHT